MSKVVVAGSCVVDLVFYTKSLPLKGQTVLSKFERGLGGKGFNQAVAAKKAGAGWVEFTGKIGNDSAGTDFIDALTLYDISDSGLQVSKDKPTGMASITIDSNGDNIIAVALGANEDFSGGRLPEDVSIVLAQLETNIPAMIDLFKDAKEGGARTILNPAPMPSTVPEEFWTLLEYTDILTPNETELEAITGEVGIAKMDPLAIVGICKKIPSVNDVIVTLGERGCLHVGKVPTKPQGTGIAFKFFAAQKVDAIDTSGAGDAFNGGLVAGLIHSDGNLAEAIEFASVVAGISVTRKGTSASMPDIDEVLDAIGKNWDITDE